MILKLYVKSNYLFFFLLFIPYTFSLHFLLFTFSQVLQKSNITKNSFHCTPRVKLGSPWECCHHFIVCSIILQFDHHFFLLCILFSGFLQLFKLTLWTTCRAGELSAAELENLMVIVANPRQFKIPDWFLNRKKDYKDGRYSQVVSNALDMKLRDDLERLKKIRFASILVSKE